MPQERRCAQENRAGNLEPTELGGLVTALGTALFDAALINALRALAGVEHFSLIHMEAGGRVSFITATSSSGVSLPESLQQLYATHYYRFDPNRGYLNSPAQQDPGPWVNRLRVADIEHPDYRRLWYERMNVCDRLSLLVREDCGLYCLNCYRVSEPFDALAIEAISTLAPLLTALAIKHTRLSGALAKYQSRAAQIGELSARLAHFDTGLTKRELEVASRILLGMTSEGIALDLEIKMQSVLTYRKRAYAKLNISSQNELFSLYLAGAPLRVRSTSAV